jgi:hypothetical protein
MQYVHHYTKTWLKETAVSKSFKDTTFVKNYESVREINDPYIKGKFRWMLRNNLICTTDGDNVFQIRK